MAANWVNVRYVGTTPISVNFKTWYPNEIHAMPEGQLEEFKRIHGDVLVVLGPNKGDVPGEGPADQQWPYGPMTDKPMAFTPTPGDELTALNVTLTNDAPPPESVEKAQDALANPQPARLVMPGGLTVAQGGVVLPAGAPQPQEPVVTDEKRAELAGSAEKAADQMAERFVVVTTGEMPKGQPVGSAVPEAGTPPVQGEPRTSNEPDQPVEPDQSVKGKTSKGGK